MTFAVVVDARKTICGDGVGVVEGAVTINFKTRSRLDAADFGVGCWREVAAFQWDAASN